MRLPFVLKQGYCYWFLCLSQSVSVSKEKNAVGTTKALVLFLYAMSFLSEDSFQKCSYLTVDLEPDLRSRKVTVLAFCGNCLRMDAPTTFGWSGTSVEKHPGPRGGGALAAIIKSTRDQMSSDWYFLRRGKTSQDRKGWVLYQSICLQGFLPAQGFRDTFAHGFFLLVRKQACWNKKEWKDTSSPSSKWKCRQNHQSWCSCLDETTAK